MIGVVMGFIVGMAICYQVLYADIGDRLGEFATLKAMGYSTPGCSAAWWSSRCTLAPRLWRAWS
jgi:ABC-type antimicrobial peptide transport system permease subunit